MHGMPQQCPVLVDVDAAPILPTVLRNFFTTLGVLNEMSHNKNIVRLDVNQIVWYQRVWSFSRLHSGHANHALYIASTTKAFQRLLKLLPTTAPALEAPN